VYPTFLLPVWLIGAFIVAAVALAIQRSNKAAAPVDGTDQGTAGS
jgi:hypothetical protein